MSDAVTFDASKARLALIGISDANMPQRLSTLALVSCFLALVVIILSIGALFHYSAAIDLWSAATSESSRVLTACAVLGGFGVTLLVLGILFPALVYSEEVPPEVRAAIEALQMKGDDFVFLQDLLGQRGYALSWGDLRREALYKRERRIAYVTYYAGDRKGDSQ